MNQQNKVVLEGVDCDRFMSSLRLPEIIFKITRGQIEPGKACSQQGGCQAAFKEK